MWLFTKIGFFSVVKDRRNANNVIVRSRSKEDITAFSNTAFTKVARKKGKGNVLHTPEADYPYRVVMSQADFGMWAHKAALELDYDNFKASVPPERARVYHDVWFMLARAFAHGRHE